MAKKEKKKETTGESLRSFFIAVLIALVFRSVAYEPFHIPSGSMLSTLYEGDYIFVSKLSYGYSRFSFPFSLKLFDGRIFASDPKRGDIVVFRNPAMPRVDYIKRLIGMPGDTIQVIRGRLHINGGAVEVQRIGQIEVPDDNSGGMVKVMEYKETLPGGVSHIILDEREGNLDMRSGFDSDNTDVYTVPEGHYFMMGDNRDNSQDSRYSPALGYAQAPGYVPFENFVGRADTLFFSFKGGVPIWKFWQWPQAFRNDRWVNSLND
jgi:signal peptidase I